MKNEKEEKEYFVMYSPETLVVENPTKEQIANYKKRFSPKLDKRDNSITELNRRRITVVGKYDESQNTISYAVSMCSNGDIFTRKKGRNIAISRLNSNQIYTSCQVLEESTGKDFLKTSKLIIKEVEERSSAHEKIYNFK